MSAIGIDFGTTNSVLAAFTTGGPEVVAVDTPPADWADIGFDKVLPTIMAVQMGRPVFGWAAKVSEQERLEAVKRLFKDEEVVTLGGQQFVVEEVATMLFAHMKRMGAESGLDPRQAVVTVPANSRGLARYRTKVSAGMAGLEVLALINEPTAAAMAYSARLPFDQRIMVVDWGGGTLDVTILQADSGVFIEQASKGIQQLGGLDFDSKLAQWISASRPDAQAWSAGQRVQFRLAVERAKIALSERDWTNVLLPDGSSYRLERSQFNAQVRPLIEKVRIPIEQTLADIRGDARDIDAVLLVGGTCKIPLVREFIRDVVEQEPSIGVNPMTAVAEGAAIAAGILTGQAPDNEFFVSTEHALGTFALDGDQMRFSSIIPRNHKLPAKATQPYSPVVDEAEQVTLKVVEGDPAAPPDSDDNVVLKEWEVVFPKGRTTSQEKAFDITYEYDVDGILFVTVQDRMTGATLLSDSVAYGVTADKRQLFEVSKRARAAVEQEKIDDVAPTVEIHDPATQQLLQNARTKVLPFVDEAEAEEIRRLAREIEDAPPETRSEKVRALDDLVRSYSYLF